MSSGRISTCFKPSSRFLPKGSNGDGSALEKIGQDDRKARAAPFSPLPRHQVGISVFVSMTAVSDNLTLSRDQFYREMDFGRFFFHFIRAPEGVIERISAVNGVSRVTGRIQKDVVRDLADGTRGNPALTMSPCPWKNELTRLRVLKGVFLTSTRGCALEILVNPSFCRARPPGSGEYGIGCPPKEKRSRSGGRNSGESRVRLRREGCGGGFRGSRTFGAAMISQNQAQQVLDMRELHQQVLVRLTPGADVSRVERDIRRFLEPYGNLASYQERDQISEAILR